MPVAWRIVPSHRAVNALDGEGARLFGGRWNSPGGRMVYTSGNRALAALEILVHLTPETRGRLYSLIPVEIADDLIEPWPENRLPNDWRDPIVGAQCQHLGDEWIRSGRSAVAKVPSAIIPEEPNFLLNPAHPDFPRLKMGPASPFTFDPRLPA
jgi:RES domain-containing protein